MRSSPRRSGRGLYILLVVAALAGAATAQRPQALAESARAPALQAFGKLPLSFEKNRGQTDAQVRYLARGPGYVLFLTGDEAVLRLEGSADQRRSPTPIQRPESTGRTRHDVGANTASKASTAILRISLSGARKNVLPTAEAPQPGRSNYFVGGDPGKWTTDVARYSRVRYQDVYPGIDLVYYGNQRQLEYDFVVAPIADPEPIRLVFRGARKARLDESGNLLLDVDGLDVVQHAPVVYQEIGGRQVPVTAGYVLDKRESEDAPIEVAFELGDYDRDYALVIDPVLVYSTYISGSDLDEVKSLALDAAGNLYAAGNTVSLDFPVVGGLPPGQGGEPNPAVYNVFIAKLNPQGDALAYSTYLSGNGFDFASGLKVDDQGAAYVTGSTDSTDFPVVGGLPPDQAGAPNGTRSVFVTKLNASGDALLYSTYLAAGDGSDEAFALDLDSAGNAYLTGRTSPPYLFPIIGGLPPDQGGLPAGDGAIFIAKLNPTGDALVYSTYLSGGDVEWGTKLAVDDLGQAHIGGFTTSLNLPRIGGLPADQGGEPGDSFGNAYFAKLNAKGNGMIYSTYLGGSDSDFGDALDVDAAGNLYVAGRTASLDFPVVGGLSPEQGGQPVGGCCVDIFVAKLNPEGNTLVYSTYLAGDWIDGVRELVVDELGQAHLTGQTNSTNFPQVNGLPLDQGGEPPVGGGPTGPSVCAFVSKLNSSADALMFSTYLCGNSTASAIVRGSNGEIYVAGNTGTAGETPFPIVGGLPPEQGGAPLGGIEGFIAKLTEDAALVTLERASYSVSENDGSIDMTVTRVGSPGEPVVVDFATADDTATAGSDYQETSGTLNWESDDMTPRIISVPVFDDGVFEGDETFTLTLLNAVGTVIGTPTTATVLVLDEAGAPPAIDIEPESFSFTVPQGGSDTNELAISNIGVGGAGALTWEIETAESTGDVISTWREIAGTPVIGSFTRGAGRAFPAAGDLSLLGDVQMSQTNDTNIVPDNSITCAGPGPPPTHLLRRFYFDEHPGVGNPTGISSVDIAIQNGVVDQTLTVNLYTLPSGTPVDTIPVESLTLIGTGEVTISPADDGSIVNVPMSATVSDTGAFDLVVEATAAEQFLIGATNTGEAHPGFILAPDCGFSPPTPISSLNPNIHIIMVVNAGEPVACDNPSTIPWLSVTPDAGSTGAGETDTVSVTVDASTLAPGDHEAILCVNSNDPDTPLVEVPVALTVQPGPAPELAFDPASLDFGDIEVGSSGILTATLQNTGTGEATDLTATVDPSDSGFTADSSTCGDTLPAGASCEITVTFTPAEAGAAVATLEANSAEGASAPLGLAGNGVPAGDGFIPMALEVDPEAFVSDGNGVFEPGELVEVAPAWRSDELVDTPLTGVASQFGGADGGIYFLGLDDADYGMVEPGATASCRDTGVCYFLAVNDPAARPATHWMATFDETLYDDTTKTWSLHIGDSFADVPRSSPFYTAVETLLHHGVTSGCEETQYCPAGTNTRGQMAVFLLKAVEDADYAPPACAADEEMFADVPFDSPLCPWIEELANRGVTSGCGGGNYCPGDSVTRAQMAVFLLRAFEDEGYTPPECTGEFTDVDCPSPFAAWVEALAERGVTGGCSTEPPAYCPAAPVTRQQMAVFVTKTFGLTLYGP